MRYRKLTPSGDYTYGQGTADFYVDLYAVTQAMKTRLQLFLDTFWRDLTDGVPMFQSILAQSGSEANVLAVDEIIQTRIKNTEGVLEIIYYDSAFDRDTREYRFQATVQTVYSETVISGVI